MASSVLGARRLGDAQLIGGMQIGGMQIAGAPNLLGSLGGEVRRRDALFGDRRLP